MITEQQKINNYMELLDDMIDDRIRDYGLTNTITYLLDHGITEDELIKDFYFDQDDIDLYTGRKTLEDIY